MKTITATEFKAKCLDILDHVPPPPKGSPSPNAVRRWTLSDSSVRSPTSWSIRTTTSSLPGSSGILNLDNHVAVKLLNDELTPRERDAVRSREVGVSAMVLWEIAKFHQFGRIDRGLEDSTLTAFLKECRVWPLDAAVALASTRLDFRSDPADEIIAAPLPARDARLLASGVVPLLRLD